jgi:hypothetical protein
MEPERSQLPLSESDSLASDPLQHPSLPRLPSPLAPVENAARVSAAAAPERGHALARSIRGTASEKQDHPRRSGRSACSRPRAHCPASKPLPARCAILFRWSACYPAVPPPRRQATRQSQRARASSERPSRIRERFSTTTALLEISIAECPKYAHWTGRHHDESTRDAIISRCSVPGLTSRPPAMTVAFACGTSPRQQIFARLIGIVR